MKSVLAAFAGCLLLLSSCTSYKPMYRRGEKSVDSVEGKTTAAVYLIGDAGKPDTIHFEPVFRALQQQLATAPALSALLFLGDNIYPEGMPPAGHPERRAAERAMQEQCRIFSDYSQPVVFVPGNHDWKEGHKGGIEYRLNEESYTEALTGRNIVLPDSGCPGPSELKIGDDIVILIIDTQWWLHAYEKPECGVRSDSAFLAGVRTAFERNKGKQIVVAAHHPMESYGPHGGKYPWRSHLFPMLEFKRNAWIPLPVFGSIYVLLRKIGHIQDIPHPRYRKLQQGLEEIFSAYPGTTYVNGHDHSLQHIRKNGVHYVTSGSGSKVSHVVRGKRLSFGYAGKGYGIIRYTDSGARYLEFYRPDGSGNTSELMYRRKL